MNVVGEATGLFREYGCISATARIYPSTRYLLDNQISTLTI